MISFCLSKKKKKKKKASKYLDLKKRDRMIFSGDIEQLMATGM